MKLKLRSGRYWKLINIDVDVKDNNFHIRFPYDPDLVTEIRNLKNARWEPKTKTWIAPVCERNIYAFKYLQGERLAEPQLVPIKESSRELFKHQKEGLQFILTRKSCMLAFDMGLGKTLTVIEMVENLPEIQWWLVAPFGAQQEWLHQLKKWKVKARHYPQEITTYESLYKCMDRHPQPPNMVVFDESVKIKNPFAKRSQIAYELTRIMRETYEHPYIILLSGSPAPKEPTDWWHQIECICPGFIREGDVYKFKKRYANLVEVDRGFGPHFEVESWKRDEVQALGRRLKLIVLVRHKKDCLDLPAKIFDRIQCNVTSETLKVAYKLADLAPTAAQGLEWLRELSDGFKYERTANGVQYAEYPSPKKEIIKELLDFYHTDNGGAGKLVIFACFKASIQMLIEIVTGAGWKVDTITGAGWSNLDILNRMEHENNYCLVANPACVHGISLAKTEALIYYSNSFSVDARIQSMDRRDRPGMDVSKGTRIVDIINLPTDELILDRLNAGIEMQSLTLEEIKSCLKSPLKAS